MGKAEVQESDKTRPREPRDTVKEEEETKKKKPWGNRAAKNRSPVW